MDVPDGFGKEQFNILILLILRLTGAKLEYHLASLAFPAPSAKKNSGKARARQLYTALRSAQFSTNCIQTVSLVQFDLEKRPCWKCCMKIVLFSFSAGIRLQCLKCIACRFCRDMLGTCTESSQLATNKARSQHEPHN